MLQLCNDKKYWKRKDKVFAQKTLHSRACIDFMGVLNKATIGKSKQWTRRFLLQYVKQERDVDNTSLRQFLFVICARF